MNKGKKCIKINPVMALLTFLIVPRVVAHSPILPESDESLSNATVIKDHTKSWAVYANLHEGGEARYYKLDVTKGQTINLSLFIPTSAEEKSFTPSIVLMGPGVPDRGTVPGYVVGPLLTIIAAVIPFPQNKKD